MYILSSLKILSSNSRLKAALNIVGGALLLSVASQISVPLKPVPVTLQTMAVFLIVALFGAKQGTLSILFYLLNGAIGFPVFANFAGGIACIAGPTGGYLLGFAPTAYIFGVLLEREHSSCGLWKILLCATFGHAIIMLFGYLQLSFFVGLDAAYKLGVCPFLFTGLLKLCLGTVIVYKIKNP